MTNWIRTDEGLPKTDIWGVDVEVLTTDNKYLEATYLYCQNGWVFKQYGCDCEDSSYIEETNTPICTCPEYNAIAWRKLPSRLQAALFKLAKDGNPFCKEYFARHPDYLPAEIAPPEVEDEPAR